MRKGTLLCVFGDHGMIEDGTHGGLNSEETDAALFLYSPKPLMAFTAPTEIGNSRIQQDGVSNKDNSENSNDSDFLLMSRPECVEEEENNEKRWMKKLKEKSKLKKQTIKTDYIAQERHCRASLLSEISNNENNLKESNTHHLNKSNCSSCYPTVRQIDLTPTLAYLFNAPVPYTSVGKGMTEWATVMEQEDVVAAALWKKNMKKQQIRINNEKDENYLNGQHAQKQDVIRLDHFNFSCFSF
ncbi:MAG: hypothetical protein EZS28_034733 [Streblomastix strix]|uniref:Uncharacterized protein n=1 Tax=Streblomastix strix TaxID=222440 RepID=A0A5J4UIC9_9EUKA|nr:MAG: hypothetical protein EZS28_034733 [Streblomastix strix]